MGYEDWDMSNLQSKVLSALVEGTGLLLVLEDILQYIQEGSSVATFLWVSQSWIL